MGTDLKTWGQVGYKIIAIDDGYISQVRISTNGYGKALYLTLEDGRQAVYAHLSDFIPPIREVVRMEQERLGRYSVHLWFPPHRFPIKRGDVLGLTGRTATKAPHLHFELRDVDNRPINPLTNGFEVDDHIRPVITEVLFLPLGYESRVNGSFEPIMLPASWVGSGDYRIEGVVSAWGDIGVSVRAYDMSDVRTNRFEPHNYELYLNNKMIFQSEYEHIDYNVSHQIDIAIDYRTYKRWDKRFFNLFRLPYNELPFYSRGIGGSGIVSYRPGSTSGPGSGKQELRVEVADAHGNRSRLTIPLILNFPPAVKKIEQKQNGRTLRVTADDPDGRALKLVLYYSPNGKATSGQWELSRPGSDPSGYVHYFTDDPPEGIYYLRATDEYGAMSGPAVVPTSRLGKGVVFNPDDVRVNLVLRDSLLVIRVTSPVPLIKSPEVIIETGGERYATELDRRSLIRFEGAVYPGPVSGGLNLTLRMEPPGGPPVSLTRRLATSMIPPDRRGRLQSADGVLSVEFAPGAAYFPFLGRVRPPVAREGIPELRPVSGAYFVEPDDVPVNRPARLTFKVPEGERGNQRLGLYWRKEPDEWEFVSSDRLDPDRSSISADVTEFSEFMLIEDHVPPEITNVYPSNGSRIRGLLPMIRFNVTDVGSGIDEAGIELRLNGVRAISEYDPPRDAVYYQIPRSLAPGRHRIRIEVRDRVGNRSVWNGEFTAASRSTRR